MIQKTASEKMMDLNAEEMMSAMKIIYLDAKVSVKKIMMALFLRLILAVFI